MAKDNKAAVVKAIELIESGETERAACEKAGIPRSTFRSSIIRHKVGDQYARALEGLAIDQIEKLEIAIEDMRSGKIDHQMARVEIDARKWFASKFLPKQFGDKLDVVSDGEKLESGRIIGYVLPGVVDNLSKDGHK